MYPPDWDLFWPSSFKCASLAKQMTDGSSKPDSMAPDLSPITVQVEMNAPISGVHSATSPHVKVDAVLDSPDERYQTKSLLGRGGMGDVHLCIDKRLGRLVALKQARAEGASADGIRRFRREYAIQGQLEHPSIPPVYDVGHSADGSPYFTMKRIRGRTLREVFKARANNDPETLKDFPQRRLLAVFMQASQAVAYGHSRGVIHRDLKPENIMIGAFGEVYVLDWGVAKLLAEGDAADKESELAFLHHRTETDGLTMAGFVLGTPGFLPPEQIGTASKVDGRVDVYALGAILFELLAGQALYPGNAQERLQATREGRDTSPIRRSPTREIPPELDAVCQRALARDPNERYVDAGEFSAALESFLNDERDTSMRRTMAEDFATQAVVAAAPVLLDVKRRDLLRSDPPAAASIRPLPDHVAARVLALRLAGRALALDPENETAATVVLQLLTKEPTELPAQVAASLTRDDDARLRKTALDVCRVFSSLVLFLPVLLWMGVKSIPLLIAVYIPIAGVAAIGFWLSRREQQPVVAHLWLGGMANAAAAMATVVLGPFLLVPGFLATNMLAASLILRTHRNIALASGLIAGLVPTVLELTGVTNMVTVDGSTIHITSMLLHMPVVPTFALLVGTSLALIIFPAGSTGRFRETLLAAEETLHVRRWQLEQLLPKHAASRSEAPAPVPTPSDAPPNRPPSS